VLKNGNYETAENDMLTIVTVRTLLNSIATESAISRTSNSRNEADIRRYITILKKLEQETAKASADVMVTVQDRDVSLFQSLVAENAEQGPELPAGGIEAQFGQGITGGDVWGWIKSLLDHVDESSWHPISRPANNQVGTLADIGTVAIVGDWGTNLYGAPVSAASIRRTGGYELLLHLGDIYYSGTKAEVEQRFLSVWPKAAAKISRALNGNHEMYSGGFAYFDDILPALNQHSSYFAAQNSHWLLLGLDTAHTDHDLDAEQVRWINSLVMNAAPRKVVLFSHHQPFSRLEKQGPKIQAALANLLQKKAITCWYWGHEHNCILYDRHRHFGLLGRCIGHGGIPAPRTTEVMDAADENRVSGIVWKRLSASDDAPSCLVLDGRNPSIKNEEEKFGPHGYLTLKFNGPELVERVHLPDGTEIYQNKIL
jgi:hypothetical protein